MLAKKGTIIRYEAEKMERINLDYPYFTFDNETYCAYIKDMMNSLEIRKYNRGEIICNEMEESLECLFVERGKYDVGYKINNKLFLRR